MGMFRKFALALAAPLLLTACVWTPGKFASGLTIRKDGSFTLDYKGEILFMLPDSDQKPRPWSNDLAKCSTEGGASLVGSAGEERDCTAAELAQLKAEHEKAEAERIAAKRKENEEMAKVFGLPSGDDASARKFAASVMKYKGWRSVAYKGKGVYEVDYRLEGRVDQDFLWPALPDSDFILPFIAIRRRADGAVLVTAPAFAGGSGPFASRAKMLGLPDRGESGEQMKAEGRFTITTDGEILTNNSEDGPRPAAGGRALVWDVTPANAKTPEALIRL